VGIHPPGGENGVDGGDCGLVMADLTTLLSTF